MYKLAVVSLMVGAVLTLAQTPKKRPEAGKLKVGDAAPNLVLEDVDGKQKIKLSELRGQPTVLIFGSCT